MMVLYEGTSHGYEVVSFAIRIRYTADIFQDVVSFSLCHCLCIRIMSEQLRCHLINALVSTLRTQDDGHQQLENTAELQFGIHIWHQLTEVG